MDKRDSAIPSNRGFAAIILCGGLRNDTPTVLAKVCGRPFLSYLLDQLSAAGFDRVILATGYLGNAVRETYQDYYRGLRLIYSQERSPLGTGGALRAAAEGISHALVMNGNSFCDVDLREVIRTHVATGAPNSILCATVENTANFRRVQVGAGNEITGFLEKSLNSPAGPALINAGINIVSRDLIDSIPHDRGVSLEREVFPSFFDGRLHAQRTASRFFDIGTPKSLADAEIFFKQTNGPQKGIIFLDRDGTINIERHYLSTDTDMELIPGSAAGIRTLRALGWPIVVVSNQTVVARGECTLEMLQAINGRMLELLAAEDALVDAIYYCPHAADAGCSCRKPKTGLLETAASVFGADLTASFVVGDKASDIQAGLTGGATTLLVRTGYGAQVSESGSCHPHFVVNDLRAAADSIISLLQNRHGRLRAPLSRTPR